MALIPPLSRQEREKVQEEVVVGHLAFKDLEAMIRAGDIDTVLTAFPDAQGRLMGKRVVGHYFLDHVAGEGLHACIYLFTVDIDMEPLPGFKLTSWEKGYGDMQMVPDMGTLRLIPWLPKTALVFCDVYTEERAPIEEAPRWVLRRQVERAAAAGYTVKIGSELELYLFKESFEEARTKRYHGLTPVSGYLEDYHILQTTREEPLIRAIRNGMEGANVPVEFSKGEWGKGSFTRRRLLHRHGSSPAGITARAASEYAVQDQASASKIGFRAPMPIPIWPSPRPSRQDSTASSIS
jgi:glutamine synthetase